MKLKSILLISVLSLAFISANAQYKPFDASKIKKNAISDCHLKGDGKTDDAKALQKALNDLSAKGGGTIYFPKATYVINGVSPTSNTKMFFEAGCVVKLTDTSGFLRLGATPELVKNVVISGENGRFTVDFRESIGKIAPVTLKNIHNFEISNVDFLDKKNTFPILTFGPNNESNKDIFAPTDGLIKNVSSFNSHYGYGLVQAHAGKRLHFENIYGLGGTILRLETGAARMNNKQFGGVFDITAKGVKGKDGNAVVMIAPHSMHNGVFHIEDVVSEGCGAGVRMEGGYISKKYTNPNLDGGSFAKGCTLKNIKVIFGTNAQIKPKHFKYMHESLLKDIKPPANGISEHSPSIAAIILAYDHNVKIENLEAIGFKNEPIMREPAHNKSLEEIYKMIGKPTSVKSNLDKSKKKLKKKKQK